MIAATTTPVELLSVVTAAVGAVVTTAGATVYGRLRGTVSAQADTIEALAAGNTETRAQVDDARKIAEDARAETAECERRRVEDQAAHEHETGVLDSRIRALELSQTEAITAAVTAAVTAVLRPSD